MKIFCTGVTGYIGGDAFDTIARAHPEYEFTCLVRSADKGATIAKDFPKVRLVYGDLDSAELLEKESQQADVVCHWAHADHVVAAEAIVRGMIGKATPVYLIHTSGTGILLYEDMFRDVYGEPSEHIYNDWDGVGEVTSIPDKAPHRNVDKIILGAGKLNSNIKTAIVCPPTIYGIGKGPDNKRSLQIPELIRITIEQQQGFTVGKGKSYWTGIHVHDLAKAYLKLVEAAANGGSPATWGDDGYYFTESEEFQWGDVAQLVATEAKKQELIPDDKVKSVSKDEANALRPPVGAMVWGANSRARAIRARKLFGWDPNEGSIKDEMPAAVGLEAKKMGRKPGHAQVAAGTA